MYEGFSTLTLSAVVYYLLECDMKCELVFDTDGWRSAFFCAPIPRWTTFHKCHNCSKGMAAVCVYMCKFFFLCLQP